MTFDWRIASETEPPKSATEMIGRIDGIMPPIGRSPVRKRRGREPKTPRNRGKFAVGARSGRAVSALADWLAVGAGGSEPVSAT
jgi:hypothetical protein